MIKKEIAYDHANPVIVSYLLSHVHEGDAILDVGCWSGKLGASLLEQKRCTFDGIEIEQKKANIAKQRGYHQVLITDINTMTKHDIKRKYNWIILGDVLEHLAYPNRCMQLLRNKLAAQGSMAISLPNIGFIWYRLLHLLGIWEYEDAGIMDKTHLRFFTLSSMKSFFERNGFVVVYYKSLNTVQKKYFFLTYLGDFFPSLFALQCVFIVKPKHL